jgi:hypothetical protein
VLPQRLKSSRRRPVNWRPALNAARIPWTDDGHVQSVVLRASVDAARHLVPRYRSPAMEFLAPLSIRRFGIGPPGDAARSDHLGIVVAYAVSSTNTR